MNAHTHTLTQTAYTDIHTEKCDDCERKTSGHEVRVFVHLMKSHEKRKNKKKTKKKPTNTIVEGDEEKSNCGASWIITDIKVKVKSTQLNLEVSQATQSLVTDEKERERERAALSEEWRKHITCNHLLSHLLSIVSGLMWCACRVKWWWWWWCVQMKSYLAIYRVSERASEQNYWSPSLALNYCTVSLFV